MLKFLKEKAKSSCPKFNQHGETEELYFSSYDMYKKFSTYWVDGKGTHAPNVIMEDKCSCPNNCGLCSNHLSHSGLANMIVTNRCDLLAGIASSMSIGLEGVHVWTKSWSSKRNDETLRFERPIPGNFMQITGGEPMLEDIADLIKIMKEEGVEHIQMKTNGIRHAMDPEADEVRMAGCNNLYLSADGVIKNKSKEPLGNSICIRHFRKTGTTVVFVPTVIKSINDKELGGIIRYAQRTWTLSMQ